MRKEHIKAFIATFIFGLFTGAYLYVTGFAGLFEDRGIPDQEEATTLTIISDIYGACEKSCPSFRVVNDGSYQYSYTSAGQDEPVIRKGNLPKSLQKRLGLALSIPELERQSAETDPESCNSDKDGYDALYDITINSEQYFLDSCGTAVVGNSELWLTLNAIWDYLQSQ